MSETKHTPLPWVLSEKHIAIRGSTPQGYYDPDKTVAATSPKNDHETRRADAEFIVRACNSFEELLAASEKTLNALRNCRMGNGFGTPGETELMLEAAIAKAKGGDA
jgi:hypothetical protein